MAFQNSQLWLVDKRSVKTHIRTLVRLSSGKFRFANRKDFCFLIFKFKINLKQPQIVLDWAFMSTVNCYQMNLMIADLIGAKNICSNTKFSHIISSLLTSLVRSVLLNIRPLFFALTSLLRRSVHTEKPRSDISQYRPHTRSITLYYLLNYSIFWLIYDCIEINFYQPLSCDAIVGAMVVGPVEVPRQSSHDELPLTRVCVPHHNLFSLLYVVHELYSLPS